MCHAGRRPRHKAGARCRAPRTSPMQALEPHRQRNGRAISHSVEG
jgi:hypothetical protein